jgi:hypothetical protein
MTYISSLKKEGLARQQLNLGDFSIGHLILTRENTFTLYPRQEMLGKDELVLNPSCWLAIFLLLLSFWIFDEHDGFLAWEE